MTFTIYLLPRKGHSNIEDEKKYADVVKDEGQSAHKVEDEEKRADRKQKEEEECPGVVGQRFVLARPSSLGFAYMNPNLIG